jgi:hypothetical protein
VCEGERERVRERERERERILEKENNEFGFVRGRMGERKKRSES